MWVLLFGTSAALTGASFDWTGEGDGVNWTNGCNWKPPKACGDDPKYPGEEGSDDTVNLHGPARTFHVSLGKEITLKSLSIDKGFILDGEGGLTVTEQTKWTGGTIHLRLTIPGGGKLGLTGEDEKVLSGADKIGGLVNAGTIVISGGGQVLFAFEPVLNNIGLLEIKGSATLLGNRIFTTDVEASRIINTGTLRISPPLLGIGIGSTTVTISQLAITNRGTLDVANGAVLKLGQGTYELLRGSQFTGGGRTYVGNLAMINLRDTVALDRATTLELAQGGTMGGAGGVGGSGTVEWTGGRIQGDVTVAKGLRFMIRGAAEKMLAGGTLTTGAETIWTAVGGGTADGAIAMNGGSTWVNQGNFEVQVDGWFKGMTSFAKFRNLGTFARAGKNGATLMTNCIFENQGTVLLKAGTLQADTNGSYVQSGTASETRLDGGVLKSRSPIVFDGGTLIGPGQVVGPVKNSATIRPAANSSGATGSLEIQGDFEQTEKGVLEIDTLASGAGNVPPLLSQLEVSGRAKLAGKLKLGPSAGSGAWSGVRSVVTAGSRCGEFDYPFDAPELQRAKFRPAYPSGANALIGLVLRYASPPPKIIHAEMAPPEPPPPPEKNIDSSAYLFVRSDLASVLKSITPVDRAKRIQAYLEEVARNWNEADRAGALGLFQKLPTDTQAAAAMRSSSVKAIAGLDKSAILDFRYHLVIPASADQLLKHQKSPADFSATPELAQEALMALREANDAILRCLVAKQVADDCHQPLEEVLALYRQEGNLAMPPSHASLAAQIPSGSFKESTANQSSKEDLSHLVWLGNPYQFTASDEQTQIRVEALACWFMMVGGLDNLAQAWEAKPGTAFEKTFGEWSTANRVAVGQSDRELFAEQRFAALSNQISPGWIRSHTACPTMAAIGQIEDPRAFIRGILVEAVFLHRRLARVEALVGALPAGHPLVGKSLPPGLAYLSYHFQEDPDFTSPSPDMGRKRIKGFMLRALVAGLSRTAPSDLSRAIPAGTPLFVLIKSAAVAAAVRSTQENDIVGVAVSNWAAIDDWLKTGNHLDLLETFVDSAPSSVWPTWEPHRRNLSRYLLLRDFYRQIQ